jgi:hypothetical protein
MIISVILNKYHPDDVDLCGNVLESWGKYCENRRGSRHGFIMGFSLRAQLFAALPHLEQRMFFHTSLASPRPCPNFNWTPVPHYPHPATLPTPQFFGLPKPPAFLTPPTLFPHLPSSPPPR